MRLFPRKNRPKDLPWSAEGALSRRAYPDYASYVAHQKAKLATLQGMDAYERDYRAALGRRLDGVRGKRVLCLAARAGTEVRAFRDAGAAAVGIDLNPGPANPDVLPADFHRLPFRVAAFDAAFSNSLDHALDLPRLAAETSRVLRPGGLFIVEAVAGSEEGPGPGSYESFFWKRVDDLVTALAGCGWHAGRRAGFDFPWKGEQIRFTKGL
jgi:SAM-dependent methyltransferase